MSICIVTPVLNAVNTIDETIWSVVSQQIRNCHSKSLNIRYHVQDGGSTDGTVQKIQAWENKIAQAYTILPANVQFTWSSEPDCGMYDAINKAFACCDIAQDAFMGWINADDVLLPGALDTVVTIARDYSNVEWLLGWQTLLSNGGEILSIHRDYWYSSAIIKAGIMDGIIWPWIQQESCFWRKSLWDKVNGVNQNYKYAGDYALWHSFSRFAEIFLVKKQLGCFTRRANQLTSDIQKYYDEMNRYISSKERRQNFLALISDNSLLQGCSAFVQTGEGHWHLEKKQYSIKKRCIFYLYKYLPEIFRINRIHRVLYKIG